MYRGEFERVYSIGEKDSAKGQACMQDPFETPYNVARTVTKDGLYTVSRSEMPDPARNGRKVESDNLAFARFVANLCVRQG